MAIPFCVHAHVLLCYRVLQALNSRLHLFLPTSLLFFLLKHSIPLSLVVLFQIPDLTTLVPNFTVEGLDPTVSLMSLVLQLGLFTDRLVEAHLQNAELLLILFGSTFSLLKLFPQFLNEGGVLSPRLFFGGVVGNSWYV